MSSSVESHRSESPTEVRCAVITVSDTRTRETDVGGKTLADRLVAANHLVLHREIVPDMPRRLTVLLQTLVDHDDIDAILMTGGTGLSSRDQTYETVSGLLTKPLPGYGELFRRLSFEQVGTAAMLSRAVGGLIDRTVVLTMPGSPAAVELAIDRIILPELGHLVGEAQR